MKISSYSFGAAGALTVGIWYSLIASAIKLRPQEALQFIGTSHMIPRLENLAPYIKISWIGILTGFAIHFIVAFIFFWLIAVLYNLFAPNR